MLLKIDINKINEPILVIDNITKKIVYVNHKARQTDLKLLMNKTIEQILPVNIKFEKLHHKTSTTLIINNNNKIHVQILRQEISKKFSILVVIFSETALLESQNKFMANLSHEIRTPLNSIIGMTSLLIDTELTEEQKNYIEMLKESGYNLLRIVNDIMDYSRLESGKLQLVINTFYLKNCLESAHDVVLYKASEKKIDMYHEIDENVPDFIIGDYQRIRQILVNLYYNSIKFTYIKGKIKTKISMLNKSEDIIQLKFSINDTGCGIREKDKSKLFKSYNQLHNDFTETSTEGTGLGLAICKELCELMDGTMWLEWSKENEGSEFCFTMKVKISEDGYTYTNKKMDITKLEGKKILVIDDNTANRLSICNELFKYKIDAVPCSTVDEAVLFFNNVYMTFDLVMVDIRLPKESGISLAKKFRRLKPSIPLIALSSIGELSPQYTNLFDTFLIKPVKENKLLTACYNILIEKIETTYSTIEQNSKIKILIDEDMYLNQIVLKSLLTKLGYTNIKIVLNGKEAIDELQNEIYDVCFIDIKTPIMSGYEVMEIIKDKLNYKPYCIALTAMVSKGSHYIEEGFDDYMFKPIELTGVKKLMETYNSKKN